MVYYSMAARQWFELCYDRSELVRARLLIDSPSTREIALRKHPLCINGHRPNWVEPVKYQYNDLKLRRCVLT